MVRPRAKRIKEAVWTAKCMWFVTRARHPASCNLCYNPARSMMFRCLTPFGALLLFAGIPSASAAFFDVPDDHPYADAIHHLTRTGVVRGYENKSFQPQNAVTRAEFSTIVARMLYPREFTEGCLDTDPDASLYIPAMSFPDVPEDSWFAPFVCAAWANGVVSGYPDGTFRPEEGVNFAEAAKMLSIGYGLTGIALPDLGGRANAIWYLPYVRLLADLDAVPMAIEDVGRPLTRGEMAEILYRLRDFPKRIETVPELSRTYEELTHPIGWARYESEEHRFAIEYPDVWPEPHEVLRGVYDGHAPSLSSLWRISLGPAPGACLGRGECVERDITIDGYDLSVLDRTLDGLETRESVTILSETETGQMYKVAYDEQDDTCISKAVIVLRPLRTSKYRNTTFLRIRMRCAADDSDRALTFRRILQSFELLPLY